MLKDDIQQLMFDSTVCSRVIQSSHWNMVGQEFISIHPYLGELYNRINGYVDISAEQLKYMGEIPIVGLSEAENKSIIVLDTSSEVNITSTLNTCLTALSSIKRQLDKIVVSAESESNVAVNDVFSGLSSEIDRDIYFLSHSSEHSVLKTKYDTISAIQKFFDDEQLVFGWASVAKNADGTRPLDWQDDVLDAEDLEPAVYDYMLKSRIGNEMHLADTDCGEVVESTIFTKEKMAAMGIPEGIIPEGWWIGYKIHDKETYMKVKNRVYKMFSIEGSGERVNTGE